MHVVATKQEIARETVESRLEPADTAVGRQNLDVAVHYGGPELIEQFAPEWRELCGKARPGQAFQRPELVTAYIEALAPHHPVVLLTAHRGRELVALFPMLVKSAGAGMLHLKWLRSAMSNNFLRLDVLYADEDPDEIASAFWQALRSRYPSMMLRLATVAEDSVIVRIQRLAARDGRIVRTEDQGASPYVIVPTADVNMDDIIAGQIKPLRRKLRAGLRRLSEPGTLRFVSVRDEAEGKHVTEWLELFCDLEHRGWKGEAGTSIISEPPTHQFYRLLIRDEGLRPYLRCFALMLGDEMIAGGLGFAVGDTFFSEKLAMNEEYRDCSPGHLMHLYLLLECKRLGLDVLDLGGVAEEYKLLWTDKTSPHANVTILPEGMRGRLMNSILFETARPASRNLRKKRLVRLVLDRL